MTIRKIKTNPSKRYQPSNYIDMYVCPVCEEEDCQMCDDEYQCQECELIEKEGAVVNG